MAEQAIADTGPIVVYFDRSEAHHEWARPQFEPLEPPLLVNEPVITEAMFVLGRYPVATDALMELVERDVLRIKFRLGDHVGEVRSLINKYRDTPMSLADACTVRMAVLNERHRILTLSSDFSIYRKFGREPIPLISPAST